MKKGTNVVINSVGGALRGTLGVVTGESFLWKGMSKETIYWDVRLPNGNVVSFTGKELTEV